jgi:hypothetical protein
VEVKVCVSSPARTWGEGILRTAGIAADVPGFDEAFEQVQRDRELATMRNAEESAACSIPTFALPTSGDAEVRKQLPIKHF